MEEIEAMLNILRNLLLALKISNMLSHCFEFLQMVGRIIRRVLGHIEQHKGGKKKM